MQRTGQTLFPVAVDDCFGHSLHNFNAALYDQLRIRTMVSKDSGQPGGVADKVLPALERGIDVVMIERPKEVVMT